MRISDFIRSNAFPQHLIFGKPLSNASNVFGGDPLSIVKVNNNSDKGGTITILYKHAKSLGRGHPNYVNGRIIVVASHKGVIRQHDTYLARGGIEGKIVTELEYAYQQDYGGFPKIVWRVNTLTEGSVIDRTVSDYEYLDPSILQENECTLSHYGLPEPVGVEPSGRINWWVWAGLAAVGVLVALMARAAIRRRAAA